MTKNFNIKMFSFSLLSPVKLLILSFIVVPDLDLSSGGAGQLEESSRHPAFLIRNGKLLSRS